MITRRDIVERVREWELREEVVEKDYVLGWVLWGIGAHERLSATWAFKGGTCLKKCFIETYRFSEDLDFTVLPHGPILPDDLVPLFTELLDRVAAESGIHFGLKRPVFKAHLSGRYTEGRIYYQGPRGTPQPARIKLDLSSSEQVVRPTVLRLIAHAYPDSLPEPATVRCYSFDEVFAEKIRALSERGRPRDLYDIINLFNRPDLRGEAGLVRQVLKEKCETKGVPFPSFASVSASSVREELEFDWSNMLAHQLPALPPFVDFWAALESFFEWLDGVVELEELSPVPLGANEQGVELWTPPPTVSTWGTGVPLETVRFAASNHLCVELQYSGSVRTIEPYSLRRTRDGNFVLHGIRVDSGEHRSYRVDRIESVRVTNQTFSPRYRVELSSSGPVHAAATTSSPPPVRRTMSRRSPGRRRSTGGYYYVVQCPYCQKRFRRKTRGTKLNKHKDKHGYRCSGSGRQGYLVDQGYS